MRWPLPRMWNSSSRRSRRNPCRPTPSWPSASAPSLNDACHALPSDAMLAAETDTEADAAPIGAAYWDLARDFRRRIAADDAAYLRAVDAISQPVIERLRRYPGRSLRPAMLAAFVQQWMSTEHRLYRLDLHAKLERVRATLTERRLCAGKVRRVDDPLSQEPRCQDCVDKLPRGHRRVTRASRNSPPTAPICGRRMLNSSSRRCSTRSLPLWFAAST